MILFALKSSILHIGMDDTDSALGMCTTYLGFKIVGALLQEGVRFVEYPKLVRLNPNVPWKTRGNGAVGLVISTADPERVKELAVELLHKYARMEEGTNPAMVFYSGRCVPEPLHEFSRRALWRLIRRRDARRFASQNDIETLYVGNGQGLVGAMGAIGYEFVDSTAELLCYRNESRFGTPRRISRVEVARIQDRFPGIFNSYDPDRRRVMIAPRGPDPVLYGIRGEDPALLLEASDMITTFESPVGYMIFRTNQGTSDHLHNELDAGSLDPYSSGTITGVISQSPVVARGGHLWFTVSSSGERVACAVYRESGITQVLSDLKVGDTVTVGGGVRRAAGGHPRVLNLEFVKVIDPVIVYALRNPPCITCRKRMKSKGRGQGFECVKCGSRSHSKVQEVIPRWIRKRLYLPTISSQRHLTRPYSRQGYRNSIVFNDSIRWFKGE